MLYESLDPLPTAVLVLAFAWVLVATAQLVDVQAALARAASDRRPIALLPAIAVPFLVGIVMDAACLVIGLLLPALAGLVVLVLAALGAGIALDRSSRGRLRIESLRDRVAATAATESVTRAQLDALESELRAHVARPPADWQGSALGLLVRRPLRLATPLVALVLLVVVLATGCGADWVVGSLVALALSVALTVLAARAAKSAVVARHERVIAARREIERMIAELRRTTRTGATGLGDRVSRALQILRDQQG